MDLKIEDHGDITAVIFQENMLDASNSPEFKRDIEEIVEGNSKFIFDMGSLQFVDSSGLGSLLSCLRKVHADGGDIKLCCLSKPVYSLFELTRMYRIYEIFNTMDEAINAYRFSS